MSHNKVIPVALNLIAADQPILPRIQTSGDAQRRPVPLRARKLRARLKTIKSALQAANGRAHPAIRPTAAGRGVAGLESEGSGLAVDAVGGPKEPASRGIVCFGDKPTKPRTVLPEVAPNRAQRTSQSAYNLFEHKPTEHSHSLPNPSRKEKPTTSSHASPCKQEAHRAAPCAAR